MVKTISQALEDLADAMRGGSSEGGGSDSDFSIAEVIVTRDGSPSTIESLPVIIKYDEANMEGTTGFSQTPLFASGVYNAVLYKGKCYLFMSPNDIESVSGDIELDEQLGIYVITGDCSIELTDIH